MARRKPKVVWLPVDRLNRLGVAPAAVSTSTQNATGIIQINAFGPIGNTVSDVSAVVLDATPELALTAGVQSLADVASSSYRLRRVVGKIHATIAQDAEVADTVASVLLTIGLIVLRINEEDSQPLQNAAQYDAQSFGNISDPWIWRRSWVLTNLLFQATLPSGDPGRLFQGLASTDHYGSVADGPHVDAKTARVIGPEERLIMVASATALDGGVQVAADITILTDLRILASMRTSMGNRRNASR